MNYLQEILNHKKRLIERNKAYYASLKESLGRHENSRYHIFKKRISQPGAIHLIAEIKKASPSRGMIREEFDILEIARIYLKHKVAAISVLTEDKYFLGNPQYVKRVSEAVNVPVLAKDFFMDEGQIYEARYNGASAILLIVNILDDASLKKMMATASFLDMDCLLEVHDEEELQRALEAGAEIVGINNRDLSTFQVDLKTAERLIPRIPKDKVIVVESGLQTHTEIKRFESLGVHAVLIGETFMKEKDIGEKIREVMGGYY